MSHSEETSHSQKTIAHNQPAHCGTKPKFLAIGIAPLGTISIGIVPMGVVCIGVVPMGVISLGIVGMGIINAGIVGMGLLSLGVTTMGVWTAGQINMGLIDLNGLPEKNSHHHGTHSNNNSDLDPRFSAYSTKEEALQAAMKVGCKGVHQMGDYWMPCEHHQK